MFSKLRKNAIFPVAPSTTPAVNNYQLRLPNNSFQRSRSSQRALPIIPLDSEPVRREPPPPYSVHQHHRRPACIQSPANNSSTTSDSDNDNGRRRRTHFNSLTKDAFCPDLLHSCPTRSTHSSSSASPNEQQLLQLRQFQSPDEDYVEIDEIRQTVSKLSINNNDPFNTNSTNFPHPFVTDNASCIVPTESTKQAMGQSLSQRRPRISLTWVLRGDQQPSSPSTLLHGNVDSNEQRTQEKKKFRSKSKDTGERLFSEKYVTENERVGDRGLNNNQERAVSELMFVCSKNTNDASIEGYASDYCAGGRSDRCRRSDKTKASSKFSIIKNNLNNFSQEKSEHLKDKSIVLNGENGFTEGNPEDLVKPTYSEPSLCADGQSRRHRHRRRRERNRSQRFGYEIRNVDEFLSKCSLSSPGNIPVVLSSSSILYQTRPGGYQIEIPLPLGMVVNAVFKNQNWLYVQTPHAEEGYVCYKYIMPLGILPQIRSTSTIKPPPCWETSVDVFPKPCGNMTDSEKEIQLRSGTRSEGTRTPRSRRNLKQCGEKNVDVLYLRAASQPKLTEKSYAQLKSTSKMCKSLLAPPEVIHAVIPKSNDDYVLLQHKKPPIHPQSNVKSAASTPRSSGTRSLRQTLLAVTENFISTAISVKKGDVVTLLACKHIQDKRLQQPIQWFFVRSRDGKEGFIPAEVAGHGFL